MPGSFLYHIPSLVITLFLIVGMVLFFYGGHQCRVKLKGDQQSDGMGAMEGSLLGLLALLLSFTFNMASTRQDNRFQVMIAEANAIHTAILRADLFPDTTKNILRTNFSNYLQARIDLYDAGIDAAKNEAAQLNTAIFSKKLWQTAITGAQSNDATVRNIGSVMIPALNEMFNASTSRKASREATIPDSILMLLFLLCLASGFIVGYSMKNKIDWVSVAGFSVMIGITVFCILDLDRPHRGFINLDGAEKSIIELKQLVAAPVPAP